MNKLRGIGLLELMLALAIISILLVAATRYFASTDSSRKVNAAADMLQMVINASEDYRMDKNSYKDISLDNLKSLLPSDFKASTGNPWGGGISVEPTDSGASVTLTMTKVPVKDGLSLTELMAKKKVTDGKCDATGTATTCTYTGKYSS